MTHSAKMMTPTLPGRAQHETQNERLISAIAVDTTEGGPPHVELQKGLFKTSIGKFAYNTIEKIVLVRLCTHLQEALDVSVGEVFLRTLRPVAHVTANDNHTRPVEHPLLARLCQEVIDRVICHCPEAVRHRMLHLKQPLLDIALVVAGVHIHLHTAASRQQF